MLDNEPASLSDPGEPRIIERSVSELAESWLELEGHKYSLQDYPMFRPILDGQYKSTLLITSRQVSKSVTLAVLAVIESVARRHFKTIYVAPRREQTQRWSTLRLGKIMNFSPLIRRAFLGDMISNRVLLRTFLTGSDIALTYADEDADRVRGLSADRLAIDEMQDVLFDAVAPVIKECMANSEYKLEIYCGTPKTFENGIQHLWETSTQSEWVICCEGCRSENVIVSEEALTPLGPACLRCGRLLNPRTGRWIDFKPRAKTKGFHVGRPIMPRDVPAAWHETKAVEAAQLRWNDVWEKLTGVNPYPISQFRNEVLGVSDSQGRRLVTIEQLRSMCVGPAIEPGVNQLGNAKGVNMMGAGIDWSGGGTEVKSRTVLVILGRLPTGKYRLMWFKIYPGLSPMEETADICNVLQAFGPGLQFIGCDAGEGNMPTDFLRHRIDPTRVVKYRYGNPNYYIRWDKGGNFFMLNRTRALDAVMADLARGHFEFPTDPDQSVMATAFSDILNEYEEVTTEGNKVWRHAPTRPDDFLHALSFARLSVQLGVGELDLTSVG